MPPEGNLFLQETDLQLEQASFDLMVKADDYISIQMIFRSSTLESSELLFEMISSHKQQVSDPFCPTLRTPVVQMCKSLPSCDPSLGEFLGDLPGSTLLF